MAFLRYSVPALSNTGKQNLRVLETMQAQTLRTCLGPPRRASTATTPVPARDYPISTYIATDTLRTHLRHLSRLQSERLIAL